MFFIYLGPYITNGFFKTNLLYNYREREGGGGEREREEREKEETLYD